MKINIPSQEIDYTVMGLLFKKLTQVLAIERPNLLIMILKDYGLKYEIIESEVKNETKKKV